MTIKRLFNLSSELADMLQAMPPELLCSFKNSACSYAITTTGITDSIALDALDILNQSGSLDSSQRKQLQQLMDSLDEQYFDQAESDSAEDAGMIYFHKARAIASLLEASKGNSCDAVADVIYEAAMTSPDQQELLDRLLAQAKQTLVS